MSLALVPTELLLKIARCLGEDGRELPGDGISTASYPRPMHQRDISSLARSSRRFYHILNDFVYRHNAKQSKSTALLWAACEGEERTAVLALENGCDIRAADGFGASPLTVAAKNGQSHMIHLLLQHGAVLDDVDNTGATALHRASECGHADMVQLLLAQKAKVDVVARNPQYGPDRQDALTIAATMAKSEVLRVFFNAGYNVDHTDGPGNSLLHLACSGNYSASRAAPFDEQGACEEMATRETAEGPDAEIIHADEKSQLDTVEYLLSRGARKRSREIGKRTPLLEPNFSSDISVQTSQMTIDDQAGSRTSNKELVAMDSVGAIGRYMDVVKFLVLRVARCEVLSHYPYMVLPDRIKDRYQQTIMDLLSHKDIDQNSAILDLSSLLPLAAMSGLLPVVRRLLDLGAAVDGSASFRRSPLSLASEYGRDQVVKLLIERGAEVDSGDFRGRTPLSHAAFLGRRDTMKVLLDHGADMNQKDNDGHSAMDWASMFGWEGLLLVVAGRL